MAAAVVAAPLTFAGTPAQAQEVITDEHACVEAGGWWFLDENEFGGTCSLPVYPENDCLEAGGISYDPYTDTCNFPLPEEEDEVVEEAPAAEKAEGNVNTNTNTATSVNRQSTNVNNTYVQAPRATVAPAAPSTSTSQVGDVIVPLPSIGISGFGSRDENTYGFNSQRNTYGAQFGFSIPLGTGQARRAADAEIARRDADERFRLIQEATWMQQNGVLSEEVHPEHWEALYGTPVVVETFSFE